MPAWLLRAFVEAMPSIQARETLQLVQAGSITAGTAMKTPDRKALVRQLQRAARQGSARRAKLGMEQAAAVVGIPIVREKKPDV